MQTSPSTILDASTHRLKLQSCRTCFFGAKRCQQHVLPFIENGMTLSCPFNLFLFSCRVCDSEKFESQTTMHVQKTGATWHKMLQKWQWCVAWVAWMDSNVFPTRHSRHASRVWMLERCPTLGWSVPADVAKTLKTRYFLPCRCLQILRAFAVLLLLQSVLEYNWSILKLHLAD